MIYTKKHTFIFTVMYILLLSGSLIFSYFTSSFPAINNDNALMLDGTRFSNGYKDLILHRLELEDDHRSSYVTSFTHKELPDIAENDYGLLIYRLASNGYRISLNGHLIGEYGDYINGQSNLWNAGNMFSIDSSIMEENNELIIETYSHYASGLPNNPVIITNIKTAKAVYDKMHLLNELGIAISVGVIIFGSIMVFLLSFVTKENKRAYVYFSLSALMIGINALDYLPFGMLGIKHIIFKKIIMGAFYLCAIFMTLALSEYFHIKKTKYFAYISAIGYLIIIIFVHDNLLFNRIYSVFNGVNVIHVIVWMFITYLKRKERFEAKYLFWGFIGLVGFAITNFAVDINDGFFILNTPLFYIAIVSVIIQFLIMMDFNYKEVLIALERNQRNIEYTKAITDDLTGMKNQRYIFNMLNTKSSKYTLSMMDFDNFKKVNDQYGHRAGDFLLQEVSKMLSEFLIETDTVCRYGGDEFITFHDNDFASVSECLNKFLEIIRLKDFKFEDKIINLTLSIGLYEVNEGANDNQILSRVDNALYLAKRKGKDQVAWYDKTVSHKITKDYIR